MTPGATPAPHARSDVALPCPTSSDRMNASQGHESRRYVQGLASQRHYKTAGLDGPVTCFYVHTDRNDGHPFDRVLGRPDDLVWGDTDAGPKYHWKVGAVPEIADVYEEWDRLIGPVVDVARAAGGEAAEEAYRRGGLAELREHKRAERKGMARDLRDARKTVDHAADVIRALALEAALLNELLPDPGWGATRLPRMEDVPEVMGELGEKEFSHFSALAVDTPSLYSFVRRLHRGVMWGEGGAFVIDALRQLHAVFGLDPRLVRAQCSGLHELEGEVRQLRDSYLRRSVNVAMAGVVVRRGGSGDGPPSYPGLPFPSPTLVPSTHGNQRWAPLSQFLVNADAKHPGSPSFAIRHFIQAVQAEPAARGYVLEMEIDLEKVRPRYRENVERAKEHCGRDM